MDLTLDVKNYKLNVRAAGVIIHNKKILVHRDVNKNHYCLPGGRVEIGENSAKTIEREIQEELGKQIELTGYIATIENFFEMNESKYHEILFVHKVEFTNEEDKKIDYTLHNVEGKEYLQYEWLDLDKIEEYNILPKCVKEVLRSRDFPVHKINNDLKNEKCIKLKQRESYNYIGKIVNVKMDRPMGSKHPKWDFIYPVNYGYIPNTISGDGEELDAYVLGVFEPREEYTGKCIAVIHRLNDDDDKLIVVPEDKKYNKEQIEALTEFQERFFESEILEE